MGDEMAEYVTYLQDNLSDLKRLGKEWGMSDTEISGCIDEVLKSGSKKKKKTSWKNTARKIWSCIRFLLKIPMYLILVITCLVVGFSLLTTFHQGSDAYISKILQPHGYTIFRLIRLATLPIHRFFDITEYYTAECIIPNPLYKEEEEDCFSCMHFKAVKRVNTTDFSPNKLYSYMKVMKPIMFKNAFPTDITYQDLRRLYLDDPESLDDGVKGFHSSDLTVGSTLNELFLEDKEGKITTSTNLHIEWTSSQLKAGATLRKLFPRPAFMPDKFEVNREKRIFISGPKSKTFHLPFDSNPNQVYTQICGRRSVLIQPIERCSLRCNTLMVTLDPGTSLAFNSKVWTLQILHNGEEISIGYHTTFQML